jgi:hypothetical protein
VVDAGDEAPFFNYEALRVKNVSSIVLGKFKGICRLEEIHSAD